MVTWDSTFNNTPPDTENHGLGGQRIRETKDETTRRFRLEHDVADIDVGYTNDDGRHSPGSARLFVENVAPGNLQRPDGGGPPTRLATGASVAITGPRDEGRMWVDTGGTPNAIRYLTSGTPNRWSAVQGYKNYLMNGSFQVWQRNPNSAITCPAGVATFTADRWFITPVGPANCTVQHSTSPAFAGGTLNCNSVIRINGIANLNSVELGTRIEAKCMWPMIMPRIPTAGNVNFSMRVKNNGTGVDITPTLRVWSANAPDDWSAAALQLTVPFGLIANNAESYISTTFDASAIVNNLNGLQFVVTFVGAGPMAAGSIHVSEAILEPGTHRSNFIQPDFDTELRECQRYYEKTYDYSVTPSDGLADNYANALTVFAEAADSAVVVQWQYKVSKFYSVALAATNGVVVTSHNPRAAGIAGRGCQVNVASGVTADTPVAPNFGDINADIPDVLVMIPTGTERAIGNIPYAAPHGFDYFVLIHMTCDTGM